MASHQGISASSHLEFGFVTIGQATLPEKLVPATVTLRGQYGALLALDDPAQWEDRLLALSRLAHPSYASSMLVAKSLGTLLMGYKKAIVVAVETEALMQCWQCWRDHICPMKC